jgi:hypothetical protein
MVVPMAGRNIEYSYCDSREIPTEMREYAAKVGDTVLLMTFFDPVESLFLTFNL